MLSPSPRKPGPSSVRPPEHGCHLQLLASSVQPCIPARRKLADPPESPADASSHTTDLTVVDLADSVAGETCPSRD